MGEGNGTMGGALGVRPSICDICVGQRMITNCFTCNRVKTPAGMTLRVFLFFCLTHAARVQFDRISGSLARELKRAKVMVCGRTAPPYMRMDTSGGDLHPNHLRFCTSTSFFRVPIPQGFGHSRLSKVYWLFILHPLAVPGICLVTAHAPPRVTLLAKFVAPEKIRMLRMTGAPF